MANKPHPQDPKGRKPGSAATPPTPPAPQPPAKPSSTSSGNAVGSQVPMRKVEGLTAENYTTFTKEFLLGPEGFGNTSNAIRGLGALGIKPGPISKHLDIRYQHARNVLERPLKREIAAQKASQSDKK
jgi:hypothetical protein